MLKMHQFDKFDKFKKLYLPLLESRTRPRLSCLPHHSMTWITEYPGVYLRTLRLRSGSFQLLLGKTRFREPLVFCKIWIARLNCVAVVFRDVQFYRKWRLRKSCSDRVFGNSHSRWFRPGRL